jgi:hypothetical protein
MYKVITETGSGEQGKFRGSDGRLKVKSTLTLALSRRERGLNGDIWDIHRPESASPNP